MAFFSFFFLFCFSLPRMLIPGASRFSRDRTRMVDTLDVIKFICKDLWTIVFRKQIDNLKTNHRVRNTIAFLLSH